MIAHNRFFRLAILFLLPFLGLAGADPGTPPSQARALASVKLLTVGNSFADNALRYLPGLAKGGGKQLVVLSANLGGHSLKQHVGYIEAFEANPEDPKGRPYGAKVDPVTKQKTGGKSLREALESQDWDVVTIQQVSGESFKQESFQPYANTLIDYIRKYAPHAKILLYETWAYPDDYFPKFRAPNLDQKSMYSGIKAAYMKLSEETSLPIIPVGEAFQAVRALPGAPSLNVAGDKHANIGGSYLAGATFYEMIFGENVEGNSYVPDGISADEAKILRHAAHEAVAPHKP